MIDQFFDGRQVNMVVEFRSTTGKVGPLIDQKKTYTYKIPMEGILSRIGPKDERMYFGFVRLVDLFSMYSEMGQRFFERNIRYGLGNSEAVNRAISKALKQIVLDSVELPEVFAFNHNGITLYAEKVDHIDEHCHLTAPRLLNGAQTITTFREFIENNKDNKRLEENREILNKLFVPCKIITQANQ